MLQSAALAGLLMIVASTAASAGEAASEVIVYTALRPANWDLYLVDKPAEPPRRLTTHPALDYSAAVSPDGPWLVFCSERRGNPDLYALDLERPGKPQLLIDSDSMQDAPAFSPDGKKLAFVGTRDGNADIFVVPFSPDRTLSGSEPVNLTRSNGGDFRPVFSPDGQWIAFSSDRDAYKASEIYVMKADGSEQKRLTTTDGWDGSPVWSADGQTIFFYSERDGDPHIYRIGRDGSNPQPITAKEKTALSPAVGPDGRIAYSTRRDGRWMIESVAPDGSDVRVEAQGDRDYWMPTFDSRGRLICHGTGPKSDRGKFESGTPGPFLVDDQARIKLPDRTVAVTAVRGYFPSLNEKTGEVASDEGFQRIMISRLNGSGMREAFQPKSGRAWRPSWSKDGEWIACTAGQTFAGPGAAVDIWKFRPDASGAVNLTRDSKANNAFPDFSPDGRQIVFRSGREENHDLFVMRADGGHVHRLTDHPATDTMPAWSPKGDAIVFTSERDGDYEVYLLELKEDGTAGKLRRLTESSGRDTHPKFSPDARWIVFASERGGLNDETPLIPMFNPQPYGEIYALRIEDGKVVRLTHNKWEDGTPTWGTVSSPSKR